MLYQLVCFGNKWECVGVASKGIKQNACTMKEMTKAYAILIALIIVVLLCNAVEGQAYVRHGALSRKGLKDERKLAFNGQSPLVSRLSGQASSNTNALNNSGSTNTDTSDAGAAYTPMTATTVDSHHDLSVDQYRRIIRNNQNKP
ncbi:hypothetical protein BS78_06G034600 [Paspalum vaginatum]|nr:hypothetical protein BS78_06G034600 [Paspalum vaginatum]